jgi:hypothetical protein
MKTKFATLVFVVSLILSSCASPAPTQTQPPAEPPTDTVTPTETASLTPAPTSTEVPLQLEVVEWYRWSKQIGSEDDPREVHYGEFLVRNPYDFAVKVNDLRVNLVNSKGEIVHRTRSVFLYIASSIGWETILPGETVAGRFCGCLELGVIEIPEWESFELTANLEETTPIDFTTDLSITLSDAGQYFGGNLFQVTGSVENTSDQPVTWIYVRLIVRDRDGNFVGSGTSASVFQDIEYLSEPSSAFALIEDGRLVNTEPGDYLNFYAEAHLNDTLNNVVLKTELTAIGIVAKE